MRILVFCNTYSQIMISIQLKLTLFKNYDVDLWVTDTSIGVEDVFERLKKQNLFANMHFLLYNKTYYKQSKWDDLKDLYNYNFKSVKKTFPFYDEVVFYNLTLPIYELSDYYYQCGHHTIWSRMEEGIFSYNTDISNSNRIKYTRYIRKFTNRPDVFNLITRYYCFFPFLKSKHLEWELLKIPDYSTTFVKLRKILNEIFDYKPINVGCKYLYFASSCDIDKNSFGETEFVLQLANKIGKENLMLKMHPRDGRTIYSDNGIQVMKASQIPWEVVQMNLQTEDITYITVNSGAFISISAMLNNSTKGIFLYNIPECYTDSFIKRKGEIHNMLLRLHERGLCQGIIDEIYNIEDICRQS